MRIEVDGLKDFNRLTRKAVDRDLPKRLGQANKSVGQYIIARLPQGDPRAVGAGGGSTVRPSATKREVLLRVGGNHRAGQDVAPALLPWGRRLVGSFKGAPRRPHIMGTVRDNRADIERTYMAAIRKAMAGDGPFL